jgi:hypothetical protein
MSHTHAHTKRTDWYSKRLGCNAAGSLVIILTAFLFLISETSTAQPVVDLCKTGGYTLVKNGTYQVYVKIPTNRQIRVTLIWNCDPPYPGATCSMEFVDMGGYTINPIVWFGDNYPWGVQVPRPILGQTTQQHSDLILVTIEDTCAGTIVKIDCV